MTTPYAASVSSSTTHELPASSVRRHQSTNSASVESDQPWTAVSTAITNSLIAGASSTVAGRTRKPSGGDEAIERLDKKGQIGELAGRRRVVSFGVAVDPDRAQSKLVRRNDVVEVALGDVHVRLTRRGGLLEEPRPVPELRLVRADFRRHDRKLERDADPAHRSLDEIAVGVGKDRELPTARSRVLERRPHLRERLPRGKRLGQPGRLVIRRSKLPHRFGHDRAIAPGAAGLKGRLDLVVAV